MHLKLQSVSYKSLHNKPSFKLTYCSTEHVALYYRKLHLSKYNKEKIRMSSKGYTIGFSTLFDIIETSCIP